MKKIVPLCFVFLFCTIGLNAQIRVVSTNTSFFTASVGASSGINNQAGLIGADGEYLFLENFTAGIGMGYSVWGFTNGLSVRYYDEYPFGVSYYVGAVQAWGARSTKALVEVTGNEYKARVQLFPTTSLNLGIGYSWVAGTTGRINLNFGYAIRLRSNILKIFPSEDFEIENIRKDSIEKIEIQSPGGIIFTLGYTFGFGK
jgi:hypothetical protein